MRTERVTDHVGLLHIELVEHESQVGGEGFQRVVPRTAAAAVSTQVDRDDRAAGAAQDRREGPPGAVVAAHPVDQQDRRSAAVGEIAVDGNREGELAVPDGALQQPHWAQVTSVDTYPGRAPTAAITGGTEAGSPCRGRRWPIPPR